MSKVSGTLLIITLVSAEFISHATATSPQYVPECLFDTQSAILTQDDRREIAKVASRWKHPISYYTKSGVVINESDLSSLRSDIVSRSPAGFVVEGHAYERGLNLEDNMQLSLRRALAVSAEMIRDGVPETVITIVGFGESLGRYNDPMGPYGQFVAITDAR